MAIYVLLDIILAYMAQITSKNKRKEEEEEKLEKKVFFCVLLNKNIIGYNLLLVE